MNSFKALLSTHFLASPADILKSASRIPAPRTFVGQERVTYPYECQSGREPRGGRYFRNFWVGMCRWDRGTLDLYQS